MAHAWILSSRSFSFNENNGTVTQIIHTVPLLKLNCSGGIDRLHPTSREMMNGVIDDLGERRMLLMIH